MKWLLDFFRPPVFEDRETTLRAQLLNILILGTFIAIPLLFVGNYLETRPIPFVWQAGSVALVLTLGIRHLMYRKKIYVASILWVILASAMISVNAISLGTLRTSSTALFLITIAVAGLLINRTAMRIVTGYNAFFVFVFIFAARAGWLHPAENLADLNISLGFNYLALFIGMALLIATSIQVLNNALASSQKELEERRKTEQTLRQRDAIMQAATLAASRFLQVSDWRAEIDSVLESLGRATHSSHVFLFENHVLEDGTEVTSQRYEWVAEGMKADLHNPLYQNMRLYAPEIQDWYTAMCAGEAYYGARDILSPKEIKVYLEEGLLSFINVPIFVGEKWWGLIGFDDYVAPREWTIFEVEAVKMTASTLGSAIQRQIDIEALHRRDAILQAVNFAAQRFLQTKDWRQEIPAVLAHLGEAAQVSHVYIFEKHTRTDGTPVLSQRYEWVAPGISSELNDPEFQNIDIFGEESGPGYETLARGEIYQANLNNLPLEEKEHFRKHGFKTLIEAPIMIENEWWGVIGFDDCFALRTWSVAEIEAVKLAARTLTAAIQRQRNDEALSRRDAILQAATFAARSFLHSDWRRVIEQVLAHLGQATASSHVFIFENFQNSTGTWVTSLQYEWSAPGIPPDLQNPLYQNVPLDADQEWYTTMASGQVYAADLNTLSPAEAHVFRQQGLLSLINIPIFVGNSWWGNIGFDDYQQVRQWSPVEMDALQITASTLGAAIQRQLSDEQLRLSDLRHREELEQRVQERTQQLAEALREIENVSYTASHDLRAPVRAINGYASILLKEYAETLNRDEQDYLQKIERESNRMGNLLDDLIRLIQLNRQPMHLVAINLSHMAAKAAEKLAKHFPTQSIELIIHPDLFAYGDEEMLQALVDELLDNAWKFTTNREPACIKVGVRTTGKPAFYVQDNGIGFDMSYAHRLFRNFEQLHLPGTYAGTGMGLAIVQRIVQRHGGKVWAEGVPGMGATIYFTLPRGEGTRGNPKIPTSS